MSALASAVSIFEALPNAEKRKWEEERRVIRNGIKRAKSIPRREREALMLLSNLWFYHRNGDGFIRPGAALLAEKLECSVRTAKSVLKYHREAGYLVALDYEKGGRNATRYAVDLGLIIDNLCPKAKHGEPQNGEIKGRSEAHINRAKSIANRAKSARGIYRLEQQEQPIAETFGHPSDWVEVPF